MKRPYLLGFTEENEMHVITIVSTEDLSYKILSLDPSTDYEVSVTAYTSVGEGERATVIGKTNLFTGGNDRIIRQWSLTEDKLVKEYNDTETPIARRGHADSMSQNA